MTETKTLIGSMHFLRKLARTWETPTHVVKAEVYLLRNNQYLYLVVLTVTGITFFFYLLLLYHQSYYRL